jgi:formate--tetrahydrofolate ligase
VVTEAGFGADLGAEKFVDIKCRKSGLRPAAVVIVATVRALKYHGGADLKMITDEDLTALAAGMVNIERHISNVRDVYGLPCVVAVNRFDSDTQAELELLRRAVNDLGVEVVLASHWADGGKGAVELAHAVVALCDEPSQMQYVYEDDASLWRKVTAIATRVYGATEVTADAKIRGQIKDLEAQGYRHFPVCVAKTQYSFSTDPSLRGAPTGHSVNVREVRLAAGAEFVVMVCGDIMTMPGLPAVPSSERIDLVDGHVVGLF